MGAPVAGIYIPDRQDGLSNHGVSRSARLAARLKRPDLDCGRSIKAEYHRALSAKRVLPCSCTELQLARVPAVLCRCRPQPPRPAVRAACRLLLQRTDAVFPNQTTTSDNALRNTCLSRQKETKVGRRPLFFLTRRAGAGGRYSRTLARDELWVLCARSSIARLFITMEGRTATSEASELRPTAYEFTASRPQRCHARASGAGRVQVCRQNYEELANY